jgi:hypothetical protein
MTASAPTLQFLKFALATLGLAAFVAGSRAADAVPDPRAVLGEAIGAILGADGPKEERLLRSLDPATLSPTYADMRACMLGRLDGTGALPPAADPFARHVLDLYAAYWREALAHADARAAAERRLARALAAALERPDLADATQQAIEHVLAARLEKSGYHVLLGRTGLLLELMLWTRQDDKPYTVALPEGTHVTHVFLLNDFLVTGWTGWFSCGRTGTGGWTKPEGLYAVVPNYQSLDDETFKVNFLAHETQHFADITRFPDLLDWEKEYRAKLVELSLADTTRAHVLGVFESNQGDNIDDAHSYADKRVLQHLRQRLGLAPDADLAAVPGDRLRAAAKAQLLADSAARERGKAGGR